MQCGRPVRLFAEAGDKEFGRPQGLFQAGKHTARRGGEAVDRGLVEVGEITANSLSTAERPISGALIQRSVEVGIAQCWKGPHIF